MTAAKLLQNNKLTVVAQVIELRPTTKFREQVFAYIFELVTLGVWLLFLISSGVLCQIYLK